VAGVGAVLGFSEKRGENVGRFCLLCLLTYDINDLDNFDPKGG